VRSTDRVRSRVWGLLLVAVAVLALGMSCQQQADRDPGLVVEPLSPDARPEPGAPASPPARPAGGTPSLPQTDGSALIVFADRGRSVPELEQAVHLLAKRDWPGIGQPSVESNASHAQALTVHCRGGDVPLFLHSLGPHGSTGEHLLGPGVRESASVVLARVRKDLEAARSALGKRPRAIVHVHGASATAMLAALDQGVSFPDSSQGVAARAVLGELTGGCLLLDDPALRARAGVARPLLTGTVTGGQGAKELAEEDGAKALQRLRDPDFHRRAGELLANHQVVAAVIPRFSRAYDPSAMAKLGLGLKARILDAGAVYQEQTGKAPPKALSHGSATRPEFVAWLVNLALMDSKAADKELRQVEMAAAKAQSLQSAPPTPPSYAVPDVSGLTPVEQAFIRDASVRAQAHADVCGVQLSEVALERVATEPEGIRYAFRTSTEMPGVGLTSASPAALSARTFLLALRLPTSAWWVNLNPSEPNRIIESVLAKTGAGRAMLEADFRLKVDGAGIMHPDRDRGRKFWDALLPLHRAGKPVSVETRKWITADRVEVEISGSEVFVRKATLKVQLEVQHASGGGASLSVADKAQRDYVLPELNRMVNEAPEYRDIRTVFWAVAAARAFLENRATLQGPLRQIVGIGGDAPGLHTSVEWSPQNVYERYLASRKNGELNLTRTEGNTVAHYFAGGVDFIDFNLACVEKATPEPKPASMTVAPPMGDLPGSTSVQWQGVASIPATEPPMPTGAGTRSGRPAERTARAPLGTPAPVAAKPARAVEAAPQPGRESPGIVLSEAPTRKGDVESPGRAGARTGIPREVQPPAPMVAPIAQAPSEVSDSPEASPDRPLPEQSATASQGPREVVLTELAAPATLDVQPTTSSARGALVAGLAVLCLLGVGGVGLWFITRRRPEL
jgi:hypothetical protein